MANYTMGKDVVLEGVVKTGITKLADEFYKTANFTIHITSGTRTPFSQARAMYKKFKAGGKASIYKAKKAAAEIKKIYDDGLAAKEKESETIKKMEEAIKKQVGKKIYISKHLIKGAADVRSRTMDNDQKKKFAEVAGKHAKSVKLETSPPHFHLQF